MKKEMKPVDVRKAGWSLMLSAIAFPLGAYWESSVWDLWGLGILLLLLSVPMLAFGLKGLQARYGEAVGSFGKTILQVGIVLGQATTLVGFIGGWIGLFVLIYAGPAILLTCLTLFGVVALLKKPYMNWKVLAVFAGVWYPSLFYSIVKQMINGMDVTTNWKIIAIPGIAMIALGYILQADASQETAAA